MIRITEEKARRFAQHWVGDWNAHDLDTIMAHYAVEVVLVSPVAARLLNEPTGVVRGDRALRAYFQRGLAAYPNLTFTLTDTLWGLSSIVLYYVNQKHTHTAEFMEFDQQERVVRVMAHYNG